MTFLRSSFSGNDNGVKGITVGGEGLYVVGGWEVRW